MQNDNHTEQLFSSSSTKNQFLRSLHFKKCRLGKYVSQIFSKYIQNIRFLCRIEPLKNRSALEWCHICSFCFDSNRESELFVVFPPNCNKSALWGSFFLSKRGEGSRHLLCPSRRRSSPSCVGDLGGAPRCPPVRRRPGPPPHPPHCRPRGRSQRPPSPFGTQGVTPPPKKNHSNTRRAGQGWRHLYFPYRCSIMQAI